MRCYTTLAWDAKLELKSFNITHMNQRVNVIDDHQEMYIARHKYFDSMNKPDCIVMMLYRPHLPDNEES